MREIEDCQRRQICHAVAPILAAAAAADSDVVSDPMTEWLAVATTRDSSFAVETDLVLSAVAVAVALDQKINAVVVELD